ncbi:hypothetical protein B0H17DRAFT_1149874 [Mycena rosella]|uniref:Uncharacterized protein n=1 Tax=Mycena rosella TaxID=1033263 RepID=A0AAD7FNE7_MYCRO|nr:hypothetical protein B0H17DRAFT_1149874 [Mycena rosella]
MGGGNVAVEDKDVFDQIALMSDLQTFEVLEGKILEAWEGVFEVGKGGPIIIWDPNEFNPGFPFILLWFGLELLAQGLAGIVQKTGGRLYRWVWITRVFCDYYEMIQQVSEPPGPIWRHSYSDIEKTRDFPIRMEHRAAPARVELDPKDKLFCLEQFAHLRGPASAVIVNFLWEPEKIDGCQSNRCRSERLGQRKIVEGWRADNLPLTLWEDSDWHRCQVCSTCLAAMRFAHKTLVQQFWDLLPKKFGLAGWDELKKKKSSALGAMHDVE